MDSTKQLERGECGKHSSSEMLVTRIRLDEFRFDLLLVVDVNLRQQLLKGRFLDVHLLLHETDHIHHDRFDMECRWPTTDHVIQGTVQPDEHQFQMIGDGSGGNQIGIQTFEKNLSFTELSKDVGKEIIRMIQITIDDRIENDGRRWIRRAFRCLTFHGRSSRCRWPIIIVVVIKT